MAVLHLLFCFGFFQALPAFAHRVTEKCMPNQATLINLENQYEVKISKFDYNITFDRLDVLGEASTTYVTKVRMSSANVAIAGHLYPKENYTSSKIMRNFKTKSVILHLKKENLGHQHEQLSCKLVDREYLSAGNARPKSSLTPKQRIELVVEGLTEICIETKVCEQFNKLIADAANVRKYYEGKARNKRSIVEHKFTRSTENSQEKTLQNSVNALFDYGVSAGLSRLVDRNGTYHMPEITTNFTAAGSTGDFYAANGTFEGLTTLRRTKDMVFLNDKHRFTMGTTVRLSKAKVNLPAYHARYGYINIYGHVVLEIHGISLTVKMSLDYNAAPCKFHLEEMQIHDVGDIDVDISGLGWPLNSILEPVIRNIVRTTAFEKAKENIAEQASKFNCEQFRPTVDLMNNQL